MSPAATSEICSAAEVWVAGIVPSLGMAAREWPGVSSTYSAPSRPRGRIRALVPTGRCLVPAFICRSMVGTPLTVRRSTTWPTRCPAMVTSAPVSSVPTERNWADTL